MQHLHSLEELSLSSTSLTIGSFDGVHRGHQSIISQMVENAHQKGNPAVVITFFPHPVVVLKKIQKPLYLTTPAERAGLLAELGVDHVITLPFDHNLASLRAQEFLVMLKRRLDLRSLWIGYDFALGRNREGNTEVLQQLGRELGYSLHIVQPFLLNGVTVSSSKVRSLLLDGQVENAAAQLGRWYSFSGEVIHGDGRGHSIGIPTANLKTWPERLLPASGVYITRAWVGDQSYTAVTNVGVRPTFKNQSPAPQVEAHLLDFDQDIYGETLRLEFIEFIRPERRFDSVQSLQDQIRSDAQRAREVVCHA